MEDAGIFAVIIGYTLWGLRLLVVSYTFDLLERKKIKAQLALVITISICLYEILFVGNRIIVLMFGIIGIFYFYRNHGLRKVIFIVIILSPIALVMGLYQEVRYLLFTTSISQIATELFKVLKSSNLLSSDLYAFEYADTIVMFNLFHDVGRIIDPLYGSTFVRIFTWFIPRSIWAGRALIITTQVGEVYLPSVPLVPLIFGEFHFNFSWFGPIFFPVFMFFLLRFERLLSNQFSYNFYFDILLGFLMFRLPVSDMFTAMIMAIFIYKSSRFLLV